MDIETLINKFKNIETDIKNINNDLDKIITDNKQNIKIMNEKLDKILFLLEISKKRINDKIQSASTLGSPYTDDMITESFSFF